MNMKPTPCSDFPNRPLTSARYLRIVRIAALSLVLACLVGASAAAASTSAKRAPIPVTFVGDSVSASISYVSAAQKQLKRGLAVRLDVKVCRRLVQPSCQYQGSTPTTALQAVQSYGRSLGKVLIVKVGYNEDGRGYGAGIDRITRAALAQGANGVVWVTLREAGQYPSLYRKMNLAIKQAQKRHPRLLVADWNAYSARKPWFGSDGLHLSATGASKLAAFLRPYVFRAANLG
jgi:hypothetical protein